MVTHLILCILELLLFSSFSASSSTQVHILRNTSSSSCNWDLPPPFDYSGNENHDLKVNCSQGKCFLQLRDYSSNKNSLYELKNINFSEGYVTISTTPREIICDDDQTVRYSGFGSRDLDGTPYTLSTRNKLTVTGCNIVLLTGNLAANNISLNETSGCVSFTDSIEYAVDGTCSGLGCCQVDIPRVIKDDYYHNIHQITNVSTNCSGCSQLFYVDEDSFQFNKKVLNYSHSNDEMYHYDVVLEWAIGNKTCEEAKKSKHYACKNNSYCYHSPNRVGYRCNCSRGYTGNPYQSDGCTDINECADPKLNPCEGICINTPGNVTCACPQGERGDGRKQGKGCERVNQLEVALGVSLVALSMLVLGSLFSCWFWKKRQMMKLNSKFFRQNGGVLLQQQISTQGNETMKIFSKEELHKATNNFNESHILGQGGYGTVYKGVLPDHRIVAIKKSRFMDESQIEQFVNEIVILSKINHQNVVRLFGCCLETQVPLLVYEFISNGSLFDLIHNKRQIFSLSWDARLRIASETAKALAYLHSTASIPIVHRDVKSANILLDENYTAKVSDFGSSRSVPFDQTHVTTLVQGTLGYLDPEYFRTSQLTEKSDV